MVNPVGIRGIPIADDTIRVHTTRTAVVAEVRRAPPAGIRGTPIVVAVDIAIRVNTTRTVVVAEVRREFIENKNPYT